MPSLAFLSDSQRPPAFVARGTVTVLFTDIEGSTRLWERDGALMARALAAHDALARRAVERHLGTLVKSTGDGIHAVFDVSLNALGAVLDMQQSLADPGATCGLPLSIRCGLHAGFVERRDNDYFGNPVNRTARIMSAAHGGQILLSQAVADCLRDSLPQGVSLRDLGKVRLRDLSTPEHVYQVVHPELRQDFPALRSLEATPNNLPQQSTSLIGRNQELTDLKEMLARSRLLTLTGAGGCGKTRLTLQLAADSLERFPDGAWFVELAPLSDPVLVPKAAAAVLDLKESSGTPIADMLNEHLRDKRLLLLLDNCEHVLDASAQLANSILRRCPHVTILASSREALGIGGEQAYRVPSLALPDRNELQTSESVARFEAVQLFIDRALLARPEFRVTDQNAATLASICARLDGIPLAIELAAARMRSLSVDEIDNRLNQRFSLLTGGSRTALPRQQTLRSLIDWSYDLLNDHARLVLQRLSVFAGGFLLEAAERICAGDGVAESEILDLLTSLCDKSLVVSNPTEQTSRFRLAETVRQYAREQLVESGHGEAVRERHLDCFLSLAEEAEPKLLGAQGEQWLRRLEEEHDNFRAALEWDLVKAGSTKGLRLCGALQRLWLMHGHVSEGREWCARVLGAAGAADRSVACARVQSAAGVLAYHQADYRAARALHEESLALAQALGARRMAAASLGNLGMIAADLGDLASARKMHEESLAIARELGNRNGIARSLGNLGIVASEQGDLASARALYEESLAIFRELQDKDGIAISLHVLGEVVCRHGDFAAARALFAESLSILRGLGHKSRIIHSLEELAVVVATLVGPARAAQLWGAAERLREDVAMPPASADATYGARVDAARATLQDEGLFSRAWQEGRALTLERAIDLALQSESSCADFVAAHR